MNRRAILIGGAPLAPPCGLRLTNFLSPRVRELEGRPREHDVTGVVVHESVTRSTAATLHVLERRGLGVHLLIAPSGDVTQHADLHTRLAHAAPHNARSIGVDVVNPYTPRHLKPGAPWTRVISDAPWAEGGAYVVPTPAQAESLARLLAWLTSPCAQGLRVPRRWIGLEGTALSLGAVEGARRPEPGLYAHHYFHHADAAWLLLYAWLRLEARLDPAIAYDEAILRATGVEDHVELGDLMCSR